MQCEAIVPEHQENVMLAEPAEDGSTVRVETVPEGPCQADATMLARSMDEEECSLGAAHWVATEDHVYCPPHFVSGTMTHRDGTTTNAPPMSVEDA